jgi:hypothetical protein
MKTNAMRTKRKQQNEANMDERRQEIDDFLKREYAARAKAREIIEEYLEGKEKTGERD